MARLFAVDTNSKGLCVDRYRYRCLTTTAGLRAVVASAVLAAVASALAGATAVAAVDKGEDSRLHSV
ncbi:uncharacterized protein M421DRAFT_417446 [Didymella exigua CBS 183.55]|uniref:Uncharacterized protein n=1 Tax=Didymella exigua CBS 183.55 TaxID=1150837 RepID=A0A6A5RTE0_9PLEO|nr:uncharacterized protein M421DRAFT_417446 [Didymella exigua CBS 183.55]KAF1931681.1 hypothetical protein M421DRAFT_417446 [Didymella exigua CBS 183.55]